ncbi:diguanylate cyclase [Psychromonas marina]|uniref:diguanylate cyclase n=1 Tax=Psychromonas marina TaxID=88364 RepID=A0ABQ6E420_9GAMM|nr:sensor domain-containing diguanylate cyclase [Psychromonas marina]GLS92112.1 diguanylate cyclase [Psychromonas marina]
MFATTKFAKIDFLETLSHIGSCVFIKDVQGYYTFINDAVCEVFGLTRHAIIGKTDEAFFDLTLSKGIRQNDLLVLQGQAITEVEKNVFKDGSVKYYQSIKSPVFATNGEIVGLIGMSIDISYSMQKQDEFEYSALHDVVTGLYNRRFLETRLPSEVSLHQRKKQPLSFIMIDIDNFKHINDQYGHEVGDRALATVSALIKKILRKEDICCRFGGDEFSILLPFTPQKEAFLLAEKIRKLVNQSALLNDKNKAPQLTISLGVACLCPNMQAESLKKYADDALLSAKKQNKNTTLVNCNYKSSITSCDNHECKASICPAYSKNESPTDINQ